MVPGNHDIDRTMTERMVPIQTVQRAIAESPLAAREHRLKQQLRDESSGQQLLQPHSAYNDFAAPFGCQIWPAKPFWHQDVQLGLGVRLRLYGLTSTLLSGRDGNDDSPRDLYLSPLQTVLDPVPNTANLVLVHHPVDWLSDGDEVDDALTARAAFHLFGHKHKQRAIMDARYVRLGAGAVNPSRTEKPFDPGYNLLLLDVEGAGANRRIRVELHQRRMQTNPERFVAIQNQQGGDVFESTLPVPEEEEIPAFSQVLVATATEDPGELTGNNRNTFADAEAAMGEVDTRDLLYRFWSLSSSQRRDIAKELGLLEAGEIRLPEPERYGRALIRAGERNLMDRVATAVAKQESYGWPGSR